MRDTSDNGGGVATTFAAAVLEDGEPGDLLRRRALASGLDPLLVPPPVAVAATRAFPGDVFGGGGALTAVPLGVVCCNTLRMLLGVPSPLRRKSDRGGVGSAAVTCSDRGASIACLSRRAFVNAIV